MVCFSQAVRILYTETRIEQIEDKVNSCSRKTVERSSLDTVRTGVHQLFIRQIEETSRSWEAGLVEGVKNIYKGSS